MKEILIIIVMVMWLFFIAAALKFLLFDIVRADSYREKTERRNEERKKARKSKELANEKDAYIKKYREIEKVFGKGERDFLFTPEFYTQQEWTRDKFIRREIENGYQSMMLFGCYEGDIVEVLGCVEKRGDYFRKFVGLQGKVLKSSITSPKIEVELVTGEIEEFLMKELKGITGRK